RDTSLIARPTRRSPTSTPSTRRPIFRCYNFGHPIHTVKSLLRALLVASLGTAVACGYGRAPEKFRQKLVILGFDGMDPTLAQKWMDEGKLPNLRKLSSASGGVQRLATTHSPESPTA